MKENKIVIKNLYLIGGAVGVGKTTTCELLNDILKKSVYIDGDSFSHKNKTDDIVYEDIYNSLNYYIIESNYDNIIFSWLMDDNDTINRLINDIDFISCNLHKISLVCDEEELTNRINKDISNKLRKKTDLKKAKISHENIKSVHSMKIDTTNMSANEVAHLIKEMYN